MTLYAHPYGAAVRNDITATDSFHYIEPSAAFGKYVRQICGKLRAGSTFGRYRNNYILPVHSAFEAGGFAEMPDDVCYQFTGNKAAVEYIVISCTETAQKV